MTRQKDLITSVKEEISKKGIITRARCVKLAMGIYGIKDPMDMYSGPYATADHALKTLLQLGVIERKSRGIYIKN